MSCASSPSGKRKWFPIATAGLQDIANGSALSVLHSTSGVIWVTWKAQYRHRDAILVTTFSPNTMRSTEARLVATGTGGNPILHESAGMLHLLIGPRGLGSEGTEIAHLVHSRSTGNWVVSEPIRAHQRERCLGFDVASSDSLLGIAHLVRREGAENAGGYQGRQDSLELRLIRLAPNGHFLPELIVDITPDSRVFQPHPAILAIRDTFVIAWARALKTSGVPKTEVRLYAVPAKSRAPTPPDTASLEGTTIRDVCLIPCEAGYRVVVGAYGGLQTVAFREHAAAERGPLATPRVMQNLSAADAISLSADPQLLIGWIDSRHRKARSWDDESRGTSRAIARGLGDVQLLLTNRFCRTGPELQNLEPETIPVPGPGATTLALASDSSAIYLVSLWAEPQLFSPGRNRFPATPRMFVLPHQRGPQ
jgi:hypothetical protein